MNSAYKETARYWLNEFKDRESFSQKIQAIKKVREIHDLSLKGSKEIVEEVLSEDHPIVAGAFERNYIYYSKGHYGYSFNSIEDLKVIHSTLTMVPIHLIGLANLWEVLVKCMLKFFDKNRLRDWLNKLPIDHWSIPAKEANFEDMIRSTLSWLSTIQVFGENGRVLVDLGEKDPRFYFGA